MHENESSTKIFPYNSVVGVVRDIDSVHQLIDELSTSGLTEDQISVLSGERGVELIDAKGRQHGLLGRVFRALDTLGSEHDETQLHIRALRSGQLVVVASLPDGAQKDRVAALFKKHRAHDVHYYSRWATEDLS